MKVLYVSKASHTPAHRDKLRWLAQSVELHTVVPRVWGGIPLPPGAPGDPEPLPLPVLLSGHNHFHFYRGLGALVDRIRPDLVHMDEEPYSVVTLQGARAAGSLGVPFVFFAWQNVPKRYPPPFNALRRFVFRHAAGGIAGTQAAAAVLRKFGFDGPTAVIPQMGVDPNRFKPDPHRRVARRSSLGYVSNDFVVSYLGRLVPEKGVDLLLEAVAGIKEARVLIGGGGPESDRLRARAERADLRGRVFMSGPVPSLEVASWLLAADVLVLPSRTTPAWKEQFGRVLIEAMACGVPIVATTSGEIPNVVGEAGILVPENDRGALTDALRSLAGDKARRSELGYLGRRRVESNFTQCHVVRDTVDFYQSVVGG